MEQGSFDVTDQWNVLQAGGQHYEVPCGRSDGLVSLKAAADAGLPGPTSSVMAAASLFQARGLDISDMVTLLGKQIPLSEYNPFIWR